MIALPPSETTAKVLNPSAPNYFPIYHSTKIPLAPSKHLLPPTHVKLLPTPFYYLPSPPPQYYLFHPMPEHLLPHHTAWAPLNPTPPKNHQLPFSDSQRPSSRRAVPPRLQIWRRKCAELAPKPVLGNSTTVMIRNIPNRLRQAELVSMLAEHCLQMNKSKAYKSEFDLVYLPVDFKRHANKGYAFVNFTTASGASGLYHAWNDLGWKNFDTKKTRVIATAAIQGKEKLKQRLQRSSFECDSDAYLAVEFTPACNGSNLFDVNAAVVGRRVKSGERVRRLKSN